MVKVYVIIEEDYDFTNIIGVVDDEKLAEKIVNDLGDNYFSYKEFDTENFSVDEERWYEIHFGFNDNILRSFYIPYKKFGSGFKKIDDKCYILFADASSKDIKIIFVKAKNKSQAEELAMREKFLIERNN